jgi:hypothetical protein
MSPKSFAVRIFLQDGTADGVKIIAKSKWSGRGMVIPRASLPAEYAREELAAPGVYVLVGPGAAGGQPILLIGAADPVSKRLELEASAHDFWSSAIIFTAKQAPLSHPHIQYIAARLTQLARQANRSRLADQHQPPLPTLAAAEQGDAETFLEHMLSIYPLLGLTAFEARLLSEVGPS